MSDDDSPLPSELPDVVPVEFLQDAIELHIGDEPRLIKNVRAVFVPELTEGKSIVVRATVASPTDEQMAMGIIPRPDAVVALIKSLLFVNASNRHMKKAIDIDTETDFINSPSSTTLSNWVSRCASGETLTSNIALPRLRDEKHNPHAVLRHCKPLLLLNHPQSVVFPCSGDSPVTDSEVPEIHIQLLEVAEEGEGAETNFLCDCGCESSLA